VKSASNAADGIKKLLDGFTALASVDKGLATIRTGLTKPPAYLVQLLLLGFMQFHDLGPDDKVSWQTAFAFKDHVFLIRDYKFGTWSIEASSSDTLGRIGDEVESRIRGAAGLLDGAVEEEFREEVKAGRYWLINTYPKLWPLFSAYRERTIAALEKVDALGRDTASDFSGWITLHNKKMRAEAAAGHEAFGLLGAFFSLLEFLIGAMYALHQGGIYADFAKKRLDEQIKSLLPIATDSMWKTRYDRVLTVKDRYRNPLHHGLTNDATGVLVRIKGLGLVPLSYRYLEDNLSFGFNLGISPDEVRESLAICDEFLKALHDVDPYAYYFAYIEAGLDVPVDATDAQRLRDQMTDHDSWSEVIRARLDAQDRFDNRE
jgi:hypothetical protein